MIKKREERIVDTPTPKEIKALLEKNKQIAQEKEKKSPAASPDKTDLLLKKFDQVLGRIDRLEEVYNKGVVLPTGNPSSEKKLTGQEKQSNEELLKEAQLEQEKAAAREQPGQPGQPQGQITEEQYQKMTDREKVKFLETHLQTQQGQQQPGNSNSFGKLIQAINAASPVVIEALRQNKNNDSGSISSFFENLRTYSGVENAIMGNVFRFFKLLSPTQQHQAAQNIMETGAKLPDFPQIPPTDQGHIGE